MSDHEVPSRDHVFEYLIAFKREHDGVAPPITVIAEALSLSPSTVRYHLQMLQIEGRIRMLGRRHIEIIGGAWDFDT